jgi:hypothetical protein
LESVGVSINTELLNEAIARLRRIEDVLRHAEAVASIVPLYLELQSICETAATGAVPLRFMDPKKIEFVIRFVNALEIDTGTRHRPSPTNDRPPDFHEDATGR